MRSLLFLLLVSLISVSAISASADNVVKIAGASENTLSLIAKLKDEIREKLKIELEMSHYKAPLAIKNTYMRHVDGYTGPDLSGTLKSLFESKEIPDQNPDVFLKTQIGSSVHVAMVHPDNPVTALSREQIKGILDGSITSWEKITGKKEKLILIMPTDFVALPINLKKVYGVEKIVTGTDVKDLPGLMRAFKKMPQNAISFNSKSNLAIEGLVPKQLPTESSQALFLFMRKDARPPALKLFEFIKAKGILQTN